MLTAIYPKYFYFFSLRIFLIISTTFFIQLSFAQINVVTQHNDLKRTGWNASETQLTQDNVSSGSFGKLFSRQVDDQIYAQPLVVSNLAIGGGTHNVVFVATVNNSIYAFDADDAATSTSYWQKNLTYNPGSYRPIKNTDMTGACGGNYKDFSGNMGIVCTPVIDIASQTIYVLSRSVSKTGATFVQYLHALDLNTGNEKQGSPVYVTATYPGTGTGNVGGIMTFNQQRQNPRPGLLLYNGIVYMCWASHCDWGPYSGWIMGYDATTLQQKYVYNAAPNGNLAGIWMSGQAPAVDDNGFIYITTGNGTAGISNNVNDTINRGESLLKLSTTSGKLKVADFFTPMDYTYLNNTDLDYGVDGVLLIPNTQLSLSGSKESYLYLMNNNKMGGTTTDNSNVLQMLDVNVSGANSQRHLHGSPVYFQDDHNNEYVYAWAEGGLLKQFPFNRANMLFDTLNKKVGNTALPTGMPGAMLSVSSNNQQSGTGILWANHPINGNANQGVVPGVLQAFDATDVTRELWNSNWSSKRDSVGKFAKFVCPTIANGKVYLATFSNLLNVYGLNPPAASSCSNTLPPVWHSADVGYTAYAGDVCYNNGTYTITSSGSDIWSTADAFHNVYQATTGNYLSITARVVSIQNTNAWAKCGVMFRANLDPGSANVFMSITPGNGASFQNRLVQSGNTINTNQTTFAAPYWVRITNSGNKYVGYISADGQTWKAVDSVTIAMGAHPYVGLAYTTHDNTVLGTAVVDNVTIDINGPLPLSLISFNGYNMNNKYTHLKWETANESNIDRFEIERSGSTSDFSKITSVKAIGTNSSVNQYSFDDMQPGNGTNFYRLKQISLNGNFKYSNVVPVTFNLSIVDIYPNPARDQVFLRNNLNFTNGEQVQIELSDISGKSVFKQVSVTSGVDIITINLSSKITNGMYVIRVTNSKGDNQVKKIFINR
ncbi:MAG: T9SS type A sorting domain-containing protein [Bacteroidota bacterium]|nr:T9SS type A sorting domain-containing protein [Bacteroidota bacterium]